MDVMDAPRPYCWLCDAPHDACEEADLRYHCVRCLNPIEEEDEVMDEHGMWVHPFDCSSQRAGSAAL